jgi:purine nucleosidase
VTRTPLIIDCDPGVDDAIALLLAFASPDELDILAITTLGGNVSADLTARNACIIRQIAGREDVPVHAGARRPLVREPVGASDFHGKTGLGALELFEPACKIAPGHSAHVIIDYVMRAPSGAVTLTLLGPMTNLALAMRLEPAIIPRLGPVIVMAGARSEGGNITASAEYNVFADPHAAHVVLSSGAKVIVHGLDATHGVRTTPQRIARFAAASAPGSQTAAKLLQFAADVQQEITGASGAPIHDPCPIAWIIAPQLFKTCPADIRIETVSPLTLGHTAVEFRLGDPRAARHHWVTHADANGLFDLIAERLAQ